MRVFVFVFSVLGLTLPVFAGDGRLEINQTCAVDTGCFAGDTAGFPVTITTAGSYLLTGNLLVPDENTTGVEVGVPNVTVDLGGFEIRGVTTCAGDPVVCAPEGSGFGVGLPDIFDVIESIHVRNGTVVGMGSIGVFLGTLATVENVRAHQNSAFGILTNSYSSIRNNVAELNGSAGIATAVGSAVIGNLVRGNAVNGIAVNPDCLVRGNTAGENGVNGIFAVSGNATIVENSSYGNGSVGILCTDACTVQGNSVAGNGGIGIDLDAGGSVSGNTVIDSGADGIEVGSGAMISHNTVRNSTGNGISTLGSAAVQNNIVDGSTLFGLNFSSVDAAYFANVITGNTGGTVSGGTKLPNNYCDGPATPDCP